MKVTEIVACVDESSIVGWCAQHVVAVHLRDCFELSDARWQFLLRRDEGGAVIG